MTRILDKINDFLFYGVGKAIAHVIAFFVILARDDGIPAMGIFAAWACGVIDGKQAILTFWGCVAAGTIVRLLRPKKDTP
jgi:hypothetical protein